VNRFPCGSSSGVLSVPVLIDGVGHPCQPGAVFKKLQNVRRAEELDAIRWRVPIRIELAF
jgi:hypothetical protein